VSRKLSPLVRTELEEICRKPKSTVCSRSWSMKEMLYTVGILCKEIGDNSMVGPNGVGILPENGGRDKSPKRCFK
jgi:hypothetical protein